MNNPQPLTMRLGLYLDTDDNRYLARILESPAGEASGFFAPPFPPDQIERYWDVAEGRATALFNRSGLELDTEIGTRLFNALFNDRLLRRWQRSVDIANDANLPLFLKIEVDDPALARLPWDVLYDPTRGVFLNVSVDQPGVVDLPDPLRTATMPPPAPADVVTGVPLPSQMETQRFDEPVETAPPFVAVQPPEGATRFNPELQTRVYDAPSAPPVTPYYPDAPLAAPPSGGRSLALMGAAVLALVVVAILGALFGSQLFGGDDDTASVPTTTVTATGAPPDVVVNLTSTASPTASGTATGSPTVTFTPSATVTGTPPPTETPTVTGTATATASPTATALPTGTATPLPTATITNTPVPTATATRTNTPAPTATTTQTSTPAPTATATATLAPTSTATPTTIPTSTPTPTPSPTIDPVATPTYVAQEQLWVDFNTEEGQAAQDLANMTLSAEYALPFAYGATFSDRINVFFNAGERAAEIRQIQFLVVDAGGTQYYGAVDNAPEADGSFCLFADCALQTFTPPACTWPQRTDGFEGDPVPAVSGEYQLLFQVTFVGDRPISGPYAFEFEVALPDGCPGRADP